MKWKEIDGDRVCACPPKCDGCDEVTTCLDAGVPLPRTAVRLPRPVQIDLSRLPGEYPSVTDYSDADMVKRAVTNARPHRCGDSPRWVAVMDAFALGSSFAHELCRLHGLNPVEVVTGPRCIACNP